LPTVAEREERIARNEALFRSVNERVRELAGAFASDEEPEPVAFVCECGRADCATSVELTIAEYERVRADPAQFFVVPGHETQHVEHVVERHDRYDIVRKHAAEAQIAIDTDPRS
jgi:hypothetical protein